ncbi:MAG: NAD-dependent malic enzyme [Nitriliruptorales bacterium]|nr:NAD-dependent malic enzyme [Nitriliruptorales bacterium]
MPIATAAYSMRVEVRLEHRPGTLGRLCTTIGELGGNIRSMAGFEVHGDAVTDEIVIDCYDEDHQQVIVRAIEGVDGVSLLAHEDRTFALHQQGKISVALTKPLNDVDDLSMAYTPGVARACLAIRDEPHRLHELTIKRNTVAVVTDGTAVLGLGDIGPGAGLPVMEGKAALFKEFADIDAFPICLDTTDTDEIIEAVKWIAPVFGGINLEDISAPRCFEIEDRLREVLDIPVFHDDQHGTAVVTLAALENAVKIVGKPIESLKVVMAGAGAAGVAITKIFHSVGIKDIVVTDREGALHPGREGLTSIKQWLADNSNPRGLTGTLSEVMPGSDVFVGVSGPNMVTTGDVAGMEDNPIIFAMANPDPEILPEDVKRDDAVIATGRSDYPNQINNVLAFPGIFRGALDVGATTVTEGMKVAAAKAIAECVPDDEVVAGKIVPAVFDRNVVPTVALEVGRAAVRDGVTRD